MLLFNLAVSLRSLGLDFLAGAGLALPLSYLQLSYGLDRRCVACDSTLDSLECRRLDTKKILWSRPACPPAERHSHCTAWYEIGSGRRVSVRPAALSQEHGHLTARFGHMLVNQLGCACDVAR